MGIYHTGKRPPLVVGESLLPAVIPLLRKLGIEAEVKSFSIHKPGATVCLSVTESITAPFLRADGRIPNYAYNTPRDLFDRAILNAAERAGATIFPSAARLETGDVPNTVRLSKETLDAAGGFFTDQPDFIVDASGRARVIARLLDCKTTTGSRRDIALFAHLDSVRMNDAGNIHVDLLSRGWGWRIPLPGKASCGIVMDPKHLQTYGASAEAQYDGFLKNDPTLKIHCADSRRITPVVRYNNYQLITETMYGAGWAMVGDAAGFTDPVFSSGLYLGMRGAFALAELIRDGSTFRLQKYQSDRRRELKLWQRVIDSWYDGRLFNLYRAGQARKDGFLGARIAGRVERRLGRIFSGRATDDPHDLTIFEYLMALGAVLRNPDDLAVV